jgi:hypothetical protein
MKFFLPVKKDFIETAPYYRLHIEIEVIYERLQKADFCKSAEEEQNIFKNRRAK